MVKRIFDVGLVLVGIVVLSPVLIVISFCIYLESDGPVLCKQTRVGLLGRNFEVFKFRTMVVDAESKGEKVTVSDDVRITDCGRKLRKLKLDELPQLFNVLLGQMSLVGPRPEVPEYVAFYSDEERRKILSVKPGITDKASIEFRDENLMLSESKDPVATYRERIQPIKIRYYLECLVRSFMSRSNTKLINYS